MMRNKTTADSTDRVRIKNTLALIVGGLNHVNYVNHVNSEVPEYLKLKANSHVLFLHATGFIQHLPVNIAWSDSATHVCSKMSSSKTLASVSTKSSPQASRFSSSTG